MINQAQNNFFSCAIALGSNLGDSLNTLKNAIKILVKSRDIDLIAQSSWYKTKAIGPPQPDYLNGCIIIKTNFQPVILLEKLLNVEQKFGRVRRERWGARTLDLDLILYEDLIFKNDYLEIPHPRMKERAFVLVPLAEIAPNWLDPITKLTVLELKQNIDCHDVKLLDHQ